MVSRLVCGLCLLQLCTTSVVAMATEGDLQERKTPARQRLTPKTPSVQKTPSQTSGRRSRVYRTPASHEISRQLFEEESATKKLMQGVREFRQAHAETKRSLEERAHKYQALAQECLLALEKQKQECNSLQEQKRDLEIQLREAQGLIQSLQITKQEETVTRAGAPLSVNKEKENTPVVVKEEKPLRVRDQKPSRLWVEEKVHVHNPHGLSYTRTIRPSAQRYNAIGKVFMREKP